MDIGRRDFVKILGSSGLLLGGAPSTTFARTKTNKELLPDAVGILYDSTKCTGCKACVAACKTYNNMAPEHSSPDQLWDDPLDLSSKTMNIIKLYKEGNEHSFIKRHCMHCIDPACVSACTVGALEKDKKTGIVTYNRDACIGCRYCMVACPFNIPKFEWDKAYAGIVKCELCMHRLQEGDIPACCEFCPTEASKFGLVKDLLKEAKQRLKDDPDKYYNHIYGEEEGGGTQVIMLAAVPFEKLGLPALPDHSGAYASEGITHATYKGMAAPIALFIGFSYFAHKHLKGE